MVKPSRYERARPKIFAAGRLVADTLARGRLIYLSTPPAVRLVVLILLAVGAGFLAAAMGWPVASTVALVTFWLLILAFAAAHPSGAASGAVLVAWVAAIPLMSTLAYPRASAGGSAAGSEASVASVGLTVVLLAVGVLSVLVAHRIRAFPPWHTAVLTLGAAGVGGTLVAVLVPAAGVIPTCAIAAGMLIYRAVVARRPQPPADHQQGYEYDIAGPGEGYAQARLAGSGAPPPSARIDAGMRDDEYDEYDDISVEDALAELDNMIGLEPVKRQVRSLAASIEAARMRAEAGYAPEKPMRHFVFVGPPGTGKTSVARIVARIFFAFGLLERPHVVEAQRSDLVGEHLGSTALKTNQLVDRALGGVLFIDEAYALSNSGDGQGDRFGTEAVQALLKRAEDDREHVAIILAGYEREMEEFLETNPGFNSRFTTRVRFPSYGPPELLQIAEYQVDTRGERLHPDAPVALWPLFEDVCRRRIIDDLGNGRFVRSLVEAAAAARDLRVVGPDSADGAGLVPTAEQLVTILPEDVEQGYAEITSRFRGHVAIPSLDEALAELDGLVGMEPVKHQVRTIVAQLRVGRVRREQGIQSAPPLRHFVFVGPPGTGKTTVARILSRVFAALGLLSRPEVTEASRADMVGEHLGETAIKTNRLIDRALGGVLFVDEAYSLYNEGYSGGDAFGGEAISALLKRAEDDRDQFVVVLAGYPADMQRLLTRNQGLASRFTTRVAFPSYSADELREVAIRMADAGGDTWNTDAVDELDHLFARVCGQGRVDELGNARFVRFLYDKSGAARDLRLAERDVEITPVELTTLTGADVRAAMAELP